MRNLYCKLCTLLFSVFAVIIAEAPAWACECGTEGCPPCPPIIPEPVSSILFLAGGAVLVVRRYLKKRKRRK